MNQLWKKQLATGLLIATSLMAQPGYAAKKLSTGDDAGIAAGVTAGTAAAARGVYLYRTRSGLSQQDLAALRDIYENPGSYDSYEIAAKPKIILGNARYARMPKGSSPDSWLGRRRRRVNFSNDDEVQTISEPSYIDSVDEDREAAESREAAFNLIWDESNVSAASRARAAIAALSAQYGAARGSAQPSGASSQLDADGSAISNDASLMETNIDNAENQVAVANNSIGAANEAGTGETSGDGADVLEDAFDHG